MHVYPLKTEKLLRGFAASTGYIPHPPGTETDLDELAELSARGCYLSWGRPDPAAQSNRDYLAKLLRMGHYSVFEHGSVTFRVTGVSRALLLELERHRFLSFSVVSQRYVGADRFGFVHPPGVEPTPDSADPETEDDPQFGMYEAMQEHYGRSVALYDEIYQDLRSQGLPVKKAREKARSVLPEGTSVEFTVTGNVRCWRDVLGKRWHEAADEEIREFAGEVLAWLRDLAPNSVQDIPEVPFS